MKQLIQLRKVQQTDNKILAKIIRDCFEEFNAPKEGTVYSDSDTDFLYEYYQANGAFGLTAELNGEIVGTCGIYPTKGLPEGTAELVKFYLKSSARGLGIGKDLMEKCMSESVKMNYKYLYIESLPLFTSALKLYEKMGFKPVENRLGNSCHSSCDLYLLKKL